MAAVFSTRQVTVVKMSGDCAFGPRELDCDFTIKGLKSLFERGRPKSLMFGTRLLSDKDTFAELPWEVLLTVSYASALVPDGYQEDHDVLRETYNIWGKLGEGTYGSVYKAARVGQEPMEFVAIKRIRFEDDGVPATALREIATLKQCRHPNVILLLDVLSSRRSLYIVMEHLDLDLRAYLKACGPMTNDARFRATTHMCFQGILHCHRLAIMHRDIKPQNILINAETMQAKIADFGLARNFSLPLRVYTHEVVTLWYRPPEILLGQKMYGPPADIWPMGCVMSEMATGSALWPGDSEIDMLFKIFQFLGTPTEAAYPGVSKLPDFKPSFPRWVGADIDAKFSATVLAGPGVQFLKSCLRYDIVHRLSARQCVEHQFFEDLMVH